jgi:ABC-2 type transport system permease protein
MPALRLWRILVAVFLAVILVWSASASAALPAFAAGETDTQPSIELDTATSLNAGMLPLALPLSCTPATIETGIDCGMADMCGLDPCLCGNPDAWGACACNGTRQTAVEFEVIALDPEVASVLQLGESWWLLPNKAGETTIAVTATLPHHLPTTRNVQLYVDAPLPPPLFWCVLGLIVAALLIFTLLIIVKKKAEKRLRRITDDKADI